MKLTDHPWIPLSPNTPAGTTGEHAAFASFDNPIRQLCRRLHNTRYPHAILVGEPGVGMSVLIADFARRVSEQQFAFLADRQLLWTSCRFVAEDQSRSELVRIFSSVPIEDGPGPILCIDGLGHLLRGEHGAKNGPLLLSALLGAPYSVIGLMTSHEYEAENAPAHAA